jgi:hypothetical protein
MSDDSDLRPLLAQVTSLIAEAGVPCFPAAPVAAERAPTAAWAAEDVSGYFELVAVVKPPLVYLEVTRLDQADLDRLTSLADEREAALAESGLDDEEDAYDDDEDGQVDPLPGDDDGREGAQGEVEQWRAAAASAAKHVGGVGRIEVLFAAGGVLHELCRSADWYDEFEIALFEAAEASLRRRDASPMAGRWMSERREKEQEAQRLRAELDSTVTTWVDQMLTARRFVGGVSRQSRFTAAAELIPELDQWRAGPLDPSASPEDWARRQAARDAVWEAELQLPAVKDARVADLRAHASEIAAELLKDTEFRGLRTKAEQKRHIHTLVESRLWFRSSDVTDRILMLVRERISSGASVDRLSFDGQ